MTKNEIYVDERIKEYKEYKQLLKATEKEMEKLEEELIKALAKAHKEEMETYSGKVSYKKIFSNKFNSKLFKEAHEDLYEQFKQPSENMRFLVQ